MSPTTEYLPLYISFLSREIISNNLYFSLIGLFVIIANMDYISH